jgi:hypothetical protein
MVAGHEPSTGGRRGEQSLRISSTGCRLYHAKRVMSCVLPIISVLRVAIRSVAAERYRFARLGAQGAGRYCTASGATDDIWHSSRGSPHARARRTTASSTSIWRYAIPAIQRDACRSMMSAIICTRVTSGIAPWQKPWISHCSRPHRPDAGADTSGCFAL